MHGKRKKVTFGEKKFEIEINRKIAANAMNKFKDFYADIIGLSRAVGDVKEDDNIDFVEAAIRTGKIGAVVQSEVIKSKIAEYALPQMLNAASEQSYEVSEQQAAEIIKYAKENTALALLSDTINDLILEAFFTDEPDEKPKVTLTME